MKNMKSQELIDKDVFVEGMRLGKIKGLTIDPEEWKVTHLEIELTKEATEKILGATPAMTKSVRNNLAIQRSLKESRAAQTLE